MEKPHKQEQTTPTAGLGSAVGGTDEDVYDRVMEQQDLNNIHSFARTKLREPLDFSRLMVSGEVEFTLDPGNTDPLDMDDEHLDWDDDYEDHSTDGEEGESENNSMEASSSDTKEIRASVPAAGHYTGENSMISTTPDSASAPLNDWSTVAKSLPYFDDVLRRKIDDDKALREKESKKIPNYWPHFLPTSTAGMRSLTDDGQLLKKIEHPGNGTILTPGAKVWIHYTIYAETDEEQRNPIDSTRKRKPLTFTLFNHDVLAALEYGVQTMEVKEKARFLASPKYAYGPLGIPGVCDPNTNCVFLVELVDFVDERLSKDLVHCTEEQQAAFGFMNVIEAGNQFKAKGNHKYKTKRWNEALQCYRKGVMILDRHLTIDSKEESERNDLLFVFYNNMAQCCLGMGDARRAISCCSKAKQLPPDTNGNRCKLAFREAQGYKMLGDVDKAFEACRQAVAIEPTNLDIRPFYEEICSAVAQGEQNTKKMYEKIGNGYFSPASSASL